MNEATKPRAAMVLAIFSVAFTAVACAARPKDDFSRQFAGPIEKAHGKAAWDAHQAVAFNFELVSPDGQRRLASEVTFETGPERVRMEVADGTVAVWDGRDAWVKPADSAFAEGKPRFHLRTWTYFLAAPFKLRDPGTFLREMDHAALQEGEGSAMRRAKLTFGEGVGDAPDDWYILYRDPQTNRLEGLAYIVTYGLTDPNEAGEKPHVVVFSDFKAVDGATLPMTWTFYNWSTEKGAHGEPLFVGRVSDLRFTNPGDALFEAPAGAKRVPLPGE